MLTSWPSDASAVPTMPPIAPAPKIVCFISRLRSPESSLAYHNAPIRPAVPYAKHRLATAPWLRPFRAFHEVTIPLGLRLRDNRAEGQLNDVARTGLGLDRSLSGGIHPGDTVVAA